MASRAQSHGSASCSSRCPHGQHQLAWGFSARKPALRNTAVAAVASRVAATPKVVYISAFLSPDDFTLVQKEARRLQPKLRQELNCIANGRLGCYVPHNSHINSLFSSKYLAAKLTQHFRAPFPLFLSDFPIELRQYPRGADMPWHLDEQLYASPQWEVIYTVDNTGDSTTEWRDDKGKEHSIWTEPNSILAVEAEGWEHRVLPVKKGLRTVLKMAFTSTSIKLPAFEANLTREAYGMR